ncbi:MAG TPA: anaerobic ribonucleoside-triphosphate reductase activating protein [Candidatus Hydrogenedentes bacterium]|nr:anaerobic ribonucleoside-triphosphate reductase activating protein [Candidatus Hydrogenedentota bacterium]
MRIGGFLPLSLCDYPGIPAAVVFTQGCNFRCPFCHNGPLESRVIAEDRLIPEAEILDRLRVRRAAVEGVVISGGEPTIQPDLPRFAQMVKRMGYRVKLDTNGSYPDVLEVLLREGLVDCVAMDIKAAPDRYAALTGLPAPPLEAVRATIRLLVASSVDFYFRTTMVPALHRPDEADRIRAWLPGNTPWREQVFQPENALDPELRRTG